MGRDGSRVTIMCQRRRWAKARQSSIWRLIAMRVPSGSEEMRALDRGRLAAIKVY